MSNGIRVVHQQLATTKIVHCGIILDVGSRDENTENQGIAHFWEHMAFKGTKGRRSFNIINSLDSVGGELNAYTDKEKVVFYASVRDEYFERAVDVLSDITFHSEFPGNPFNLIKRYVADDGKRNLIRTEMILEKMQEIALRK